MCFLFKFILMYSKLNSNRFLLIPFDLQEDLT